MVDLSDYALGDYSPAHRDELQRLLETPGWRRALAGGLVERVRRERIAPGSTRDFIGTVVDQLLAFNQDEVRHRIEAGEVDRQALADRLGRWPERLHGCDPQLSFLGLTVTYGCNFDPRCTYCHQRWREPDVDLEGWKRIVEQATRANGGRGPYIYITGGEPLTLEEGIWGDEGLVAFASRRGAAVNVNTNASLITPEVALRLVKVGLAKLHISVDTADRARQDQLWGAPGRRDRVLEGIYHVQLARDLVGADHPEIHTNCVLMKGNLDAFPDLFAFLLEKKKRVPKGHPLFLDLLPHLIPVGGEDNDGLRPAAEDFERFYTAVWDKVVARWRQYQVEELKLAEDQRGDLSGFFRSPFLRVEHEGGMEAYTRASAAGHYGALALPRYCYVAPTQASVTPDGLQFRCGSHAVRRLLPTGSAASDDLLDNVRRSVDALPGLPRHAACDGCALATLHINQAVARRLGAKVDEMLAAMAAPATATA